MNIRSNIVYIEGIESIFPSDTNITFTDKDSTRICIDMRTLIHLYDNAKFNVEHSGINWEEYTKELFNQNTSANTISVFDIIPYRRFR